MASDIVFFVSRFCFFTFGKFLRSRTNVAPDPERRFAFAHLPFRAGELGVRLLREMSVAKVKRRNIRIVFGRG